MYGQERIGHFRLTGKLNAHDEALLRYAQSPFSESRFGFELTKISRRDVLVYALVELVRNYSLDDSRRLVVKVTSAISNMSFMKLAKRSDASDKAQALNSQRMSIAAGVSSKSARTLAKETIKQIIRSMDGSEVISAQSALINHHKSPKGAAVIAVLLPEVRQ